MAGSLSCNVISGSMLVGILLALMQECTTSSSPPSLSPPPLSPSLPSSLLLSILFWCSPSPPFSPPHPLFPSLSLPPSPFSHTLPLPSHTFFPPFSSLSKVEIPASRLSALPFRAFPSNSSSSNPHNATELKAVCCHLRNIRNRVHHQLRPLTFVVHINGRIHCRKRAMVQSSI